MAEPSPKPVDVSVIIPAHNRPEFLPDCIASILEQEWSGHLEIICVDDGSENDPFSALPDPLPDNVRLFRKANGGVSSARLYGFEQAKGRYIAFNDDDDLWMPGRLQTQMDLLEVHADLDMIFSDLIEFTENGDADETHFSGRMGFMRKAGRRVTATEPPLYRFERDALIEGFMSNIPVFFQTVLARRELIERMGGINPHLRSAAECTDFALRTNHFGTIAFLDQPTFRLRRGHSHETASVGWIDRDIKEFLALYPTFPPDLRREIEPHLGIMLSSKGYLHFKRAEYRDAASAYRHAARHGRISGRSRIKWGLAAVLGMVERVRPGGKGGDHASAG